MRSLLIILFVLISVTNSPKWLSSSIKDSEPAKQKSGKKKTLKPYITKHRSDLELVEQEILKCREILIQTPKGWEQAFTSKERTDALTKLTEFKKDLGTITECKGRWTTGLFLLDLSLKDNILDTIGKTGIKFIMPLYRNLMKTEEDRKVQKIIFHAMCTKPSQEDQDKIKNHLHSMYSTCHKDQQFEHCCCF